jgi:hypothetical protein
VRRSADTPRRALWAASTALLCVAFSLAHAAPRPSKTATSNDANLMVRLVAKSFVAGLLGKGDAAALCGLPINLDGRVIKTRMGLSRALAAVSKRAQKKRLSMRGQPKVMSYQAMMARFGKPPARLAAFIKPNDHFVLVRLNRSGVVIGLRKIERFWRVILVTD